MTRPRLAILCPMFGYAPVQFVQSMIHFIPKASLVFEPYILTSIGGYIPENRNMLVKQFVEMEEKIGKMDYVLFLDSDIEFDQLDVVDLYHSMEQQPEIQMLSGISYAYKDGETFPLVMKQLLGNRYASIKTNGIQMIDSASLGFFLMKANVLRELIVKNNGSTRLFAFSERDGQFMGEDNLFFEFAKRSGFQLWVDSDVVVRHVKPIGIGFPVKGPYRVWKEDAE